MCHASTAIVGTWVAIQEANPSSGPERGFFKDAAVSLGSDSGY
jgi:hypothetical protein